MLKFLYKISYFKIPEFIMNNFVLRQKMNSLKTIAKSGHYKNRMYIVERINLLSNENKLKLIEILYDDKIEIISKSAIKESSKLILPKLTKAQIIEKTEYWINKKIEAKKNGEKIKRLLKNTTNRKRKFSNGESYQNLKNMLKKPMNTGKWM